MLDFLIYVDVTPLILTHSEYVNLSSPIAILSIIMASRFWGAWFCNNKWDKAHVVSIKIQEEKAMYHGRWTMLKEYTGCCSMSEG